MRLLSITTAGLLIFAASLYSAGEQEWGRAVGLDFWHLPAEHDRIRCLLADECQLNDNWDAVQRRAEAGDLIAIRLCDCRLTLAEAIDTVEGMCSAYPGWLHTLRSHYEQDAAVPLGATDREVQTEYLFSKVRSRILAAERRGDATQAAALSARLAQLKAESRPAAGE